MLTWRSNQVWHWFAWTACWQTCRVADDSAGRPDTDSVSHYAHAAWYSPSVSNMLCFITYMYQPWVFIYLRGLADGGLEPGGDGDRKGLKGGTGGPGRVFGGGENGAGLYSLFRAEAAGPAAAGGDHPAHPPQVRVHTPPSAVQLSSSCPCLSNHQGYQLMKEAWHSARSGSTWRNA